MKKLQCSTVKKFHDMISCFNRMPACDRRTDRQTSSKRIDRFGLYVRTTSRLSRIALVFMSIWHRDCRGPLSRTALVCTSQRHRDCRGLLWSLRPDDIETVEDHFGLYAGTTLTLSRTALVFRSGRHRDCRGPLWSVCRDNIETVEDCFGL